MSKKPAAKQRTTKRKAANAGLDDDIGGSIDLSQYFDVSKSTPKAIASTLLTLLPVGATRQHELAAKLTKAFPLLIAELDSRSAIAARASESEGTLKPINFRFPQTGSEKGGKWTTVQLPEDPFVAIMKFITGEHLVNKVSFVSKSWLAMSRSPSLWEKLDKSCGLTNKRKAKLNMTDLQNLLRRPQFANLKYLRMPDRCIKLSKNGVKQIAKACPHLETFSMEYGRCISGTKSTDDVLLSAAENFSKLKGIHTGTWSITPSAILSAAKMMEGQLRDLRIYGETITEHYINDTIIGSIAKFCPNLQYFAYKQSTYEYKAARDLSGHGLIGLIKDCRDLEVLELGNVLRVGREAFEEIVRMLELSKVSASATAEVFALRKIILWGYPFSVADDPLRITDEPSPQESRDIDPEDAKLGEQMSHKFQRDFESMLARRRGSQCSDSESSDED